MKHYCRFCKTELTHSFCDLGMSPLSNAYLNAEELQSMERFYPLHAYVCENCWLVQLPEFESPTTIFKNYPYFSSYSDSWLAHAKRYTKTMIRRFSLNKKTQVVEIASNDGYLLQYFLKENISVLGIEPAANVAKVAQDKGISTLTKFFGVATAEALAAENTYADLLIGNNVLAHVPNINDFVGGVKILLKPEGIVTFEFPHLLNLISKQEFDTIYHEHFSYLSLLTVEKIFAYHGLRIFDVEELPTHGGSLRIYACHQNYTKYNNSLHLQIVRNKEIQAAFQDLQTYTQFSQQVETTKRNILKFFIKSKEANKQIVGYGAPAKGNTLLNYCGIRSDFLDYTVDLNPHKQGHFLPGSHIPIFNPDKIIETKPDYVVILPWNLQDEIIHQMQHVRDWGGQFVTLIPKISII